MRNFNGSAIILYIFFTTILKQPMSNLEDYVNLFSLWQILHSVLCICFNSIIYIFNGVTILYIICVCGYVK